MIVLDGVDEVCDVEAPKEGGEVTTFCNSFGDLDVGVVVGESVDWENQFNITEEDDGRVGSVGSFILVKDVGEECVDCRGFVGVTDTPLERV